MKPPLLMVEDVWKAASWDLFPVRQPPLSGDGSGNNGRKRIIFKQRRCSAEDQLRERQTSALDEGTCAAADPPIHGAVRCLRRLPAMWHGCNMWDSKQSLPPLLIFIHFYFFCHLQIVFCLHIAVACGAQFSQAPEGQPMAPLRAPAGPSGTLTWR